MNKIYILVLMLLVSIAACEGPQGPPGIPGPQGPPGQNGLDGLNGENAYVFEYVFNFEAPDYSIVLPFPQDLTTYDSDVVLVYLLWGISEIDGEEVEIWRLMPQSQIMEFGWLQYNFDFTLRDVSVFLEADFPLTQLGPDYTDNWVARVVVVPGEFVPLNGRLNVDVNDYYAVQEAFGLPETSLPEGYRITPRTLK